MLMSNRSSMKPALDCKAGGETPKNMCSPASGWRGEAHLPHFLRDAAPLRRGPGPGPDLRPTAGARKCGAGLE